MAGWSPAPPGSRLCGRNCRRHRTLENEAEQGELLTPGLAISLLLMAIIDTIE
jgi:hypothetical protein